jgi:hypothetical protein
MKVIHQSNPKQITIYTEIERQQTTTFLFITLDPEYINMQVANFFFNEKNKQN